MIDALFDYFYGLFYGNASYTYGSMMENAETFKVCGLEVDIATYFTLICTWISFIFIVVLCCLFIWKIIKLVGGLIR